MTETTANSPLAVRVEGVLWDPVTVWPLAVAHVASRFARVAALDAAALPAVTSADDLAAAVEAVDAWAAGGGIDWQREFVRWLDENLSRHLRPDVAISRHVRALGRSRELVACSALPTAATEAVLRHAGVNRAFAAVEQGAREQTVTQREELLGLGP